MTISGMTVWGSGKSCLREKKCSSAGRLAFLSDLGLSSPPGAPTSLLQKQGLKGAAWEQVPVCQELSLRPAVPSPRLREKASCPRSHSKRGKRLGT